jgi:hypothetical protein
MKKVRHCSSSATFSLVVVGHHLAIFTLKVTMLVPPAFVITN